MALIFSFEKKMGREFLAMVREKVDLTHVLTFRQTCAGITLLLLLLLLRLLLPAPLMAPMLYVEIPEHFARFRQTA